LTLFLLTTLPLTAQQTSPDQQPPEAPASATLTQAVELQPGLLRSDIAATPQAARPAVTESVFAAGPSPAWIWGPDDNTRYILRTTVDLPVAKAARLRASCDNRGTVFINGKRVAGSSEWQEPMDADVTSALVDSANTIEAEVENQGGVAAFVLKLVVVTGSGETITVVTDESWQCAPRREDAFSAVQKRGTYGAGPWGSVFENAAVAGRVPAGTFELLPGFQVDKLFTVPKDELGSWVCITFDNKGRLLASDQGDLGICRITLPPVSNVPSPPQAGEKVADRPDEGADPDLKSQISNLKFETTVERLDFSKCEYQPTGAQGMLWAFDSLYFSINGGPGSGLYRARDTNGDDQFDECMKLKELRGGGEHGPHALRLSPDGKRIFVICGNHTLPPFNAGDERTNKDFTSRVPTNWAEDHLLPRMWDANGHAVGIMAPGGWIASTDADGRTWDIWSIGYRNPYDMAFNADGELFAYDADMEWDVGMPWYRPTRVVHATSGSEFGWRSGSGKWPNVYQDSLPPMVDIGPGSPVGVDFGYGLHFPAKYQKALYICDWTFGTMYAIHIEPRLSSYTATKEEFLSRTPLPLTDVVAGPDGAMYFTTGGRGTQSELFRVTYTGEESTSPAELRNPAGAGFRSSRRVLEGLHAGIGTNGRQPQASGDQLLNQLREAIRSGDRFIRTASRNAFYHSLLFDELATPEVMNAADFSTLPPEEVLSVVTSLARAPWNSTRAGQNPESLTALQKATQGSCLKALQSLSFTALNAEQKQQYLRALSLVFLRLGEVSDQTRTTFIGILDSQFPSNDDGLNRELCQMLVYLKSPTIIEKTVALLAPVEGEGRKLSVDGGPGATQPEGSRPSASSAAEPTADLLARNRGYGSAIRASLEKAPDQQQIWYAFCLRNLKDGWTMDQRKAYFAWFERAHTWAGGASFHGFLRNIERECFENASEAERLLIEASGARKPYQPPEIPKPSGPGKDWTLAEVRALAESGLKERDFENGQKMFAATRCVLCHRFAGDGGATGPDLTQLAGRFNVNDLTEAIMDPGKVISDQYKGTTVVTKAGQVYSGRILADHDGKVTVLTNPEDPTKIVELASTDIEERQPATASIMPADLLKPLNQDEVLDLLAYLLSRGDERNPMFKRR
jgi:putative heme-binding domain-containing protein